MHVDTYTRGRHFGIFSTIQNNLDNTCRMAYISLVQPYEFLHQLSRTRLSTDPIFPFFFMPRLSR